MTDTPQELRELRHEVYAADSRDFPLSKWVEWARALSHALDVSETQRVAQAGELDRYREALEMARPPLHAGMVAFGDDPRAELLRQGCRVGYEAVVSALAGAVSSGEEA